MSATPTLPRAGAVGGRPVAPPQPLLTLPALSVKQPWASLLVAGLKEFETRNRATKHRGPLAIAASAKYDLADRELAAGEPFWTALASANLQPDTLPVGCVVGLVSVKGCVPVTADSHLERLSERELAFGDFTPGRYGWWCERPLEFRRPPAVRGALGLWRWLVPADLRAEVERYIDEVKA